MLIIVEGKNDKAKLRRILNDRTEIACTFGTPGTDQLERLRKLGKNREVAIFTDNDASGRKIRKLVSDLFPDAEQLYTRKGYAGVEHTPDDYLLHQLEKAGLEEFVDYEKAAANGVITQLESDKSRRLL